jgi:hypothetical protein
MWIEKRLKQSTDKSTKTTVTLPHCVNGFQYHFGTIGEQHQVQQGKGKQ